MEYGTMGLVNPQRASGKAMSSWKGMGWGPSVLQEANFSRGGSCYVEHLPLDSLTLYLLVDEDP